MTSRIAALLAVVLALLPAAALAHPLGNFTVSRYARLEVAPGQVRVRYVVDMAEVPTFQEKAALDRGTEVYRAAKAEELRAGLTLSADGRSLPLRLEQAVLELPPGQAGLPTLRLALWLSASLPGTAGQLDFRDENFAGRIGWREVVVRPVDGARIAESSAPSEDLSDELRRYPDELASQPPQVSQARLRLGPPGAGAAVGATQLFAGGPIGSTESTPGDAAALAGMVAAGELGGGAIALALLAAAAWGAAHALTPGHGKTVVAAYLVGSRGTARHALYLGLTVTATHTLGIYALGLATLFAASYVLPERLYPWLSLASGLAVVAVGVSLLVARLPRGADHGHDHHHAHGDDHDHHHEGHHHHHDHAHHGHHHLPPERVSLRGLIGLGIAGGLLPCPSALVLLLGSIALGQVGFGLLLVVAFSLGLALVLTAIGIALVCARRLVEAPRLARLPRAPLLRWAPVVSALAVTMVGAAMSVQALTGIV